jgi:hypothetical protein
MCLKKVSLLTQSYLDTDLFSASVAGSQSMIHKDTQRDHKVSTKTTSRPYHSQPNHLIERGSQTAYNCKPDYHDSCTLWKGSTLYPRVVISSLRGWLENLIFAILTLPLVYGPEITICRYKGLLQEYVMLCYGFLNKQSLLAVLRFPAQMSILAPCGSGDSQSMMKGMSHSIMPFPLNRARHTTYSSSN